MFPQQLNGSIDFIRGLSWSKLNVFGAAHILCQPNSGVFTPPSSAMVSICLTPPPPLASIWPTPFYLSFQRKNTFWYDIIKAFWLFRTKKHIICQSWLNFDLLHIALTLEDQFYWIFLWLDPPSSAIVSIGLTPPPPPSAADIICGQPLTVTRKGWKLKTTTFLLGVQQLLVAADILGLLFFRFTWLNRKRQIVLKMLLEQSITNPNIWKETLRLECFAPDVN